MGTKRAAFLSGCKHAFPIALGYFSISITFGILSVSTGLQAFEATTMSALVYAGASQFIAISLMGVANWIEIVLATFVLNLRHLLMSTTLARTLKTSKWKAALLSFGITDETFVLATVGQGQEQDAKELKGSYFAGIVITSYLSWVTGTAVGALFGSFIPEALTSSMGIGLYAMYIALLTPAIKSSKKNLWIAASSASVCTLLFFQVPQLSQGWAIVISTMLVATIATLSRKTTPLPSTAEKEESA